VVALLLAAPPAGAASRAPTASEYQAITRAFQRDARPGHRHAHDRIIEVRETVGGSPVARVFFARLRAHMGTSRANGGIGQCGDCSDYYFRPTGQWKPDPKVSKAIRDQLKEAPPAWDARFVGTGTDHIDASAPGDVASNPYCRQPPVVETGDSSFKFDVGWGVLGIEGLATSGVGGTTGRGSFTHQEKPGCVNQTEPITPMTSTCTTRFFTSPIGKAPHATLSWAVDSKGNHELRLHAPTPDQRPAGCAAPTEWFIESQGPVLFLRSVLVPDAEIVRGSEIFIKVGDKRSFPCFNPAGYRNSKCGEVISWSGTIQLKPEPDWRKLHFTD
jgi:hypothetical protein